MAIQIPCSCGRTFAVGDGFAGREVKCTFCGAVHVAPGGDAPASPQKPRCPFCAREVEPDQAACPHCNENLQRHREDLPVSPLKSVPAGRICEGCNEPLPPRVSTCPACGEAAAPDVQEPSVAWEDAEKGVFARYWSTWADSQFKADLFFSRMRWHGGLGKPLKYLLFYLVQLLALACLCGGPFVGLMLAEDQGGDPAFGAGIVLGIAVGYFVVLFLGAIIGSYVWAFIIHMSAQLFGGKGNYEASYRAVCYSSGSQVWSLVPYVGGLAALVFQVICLTHALHYGHRLSKQNACFAALLPMVVCCGLLFGGFVMFFVASGEMIPNQN